MSFRWIGSPERDTPACLLARCLPPDKSSSQHQLLCPSRNNNIVSDRRWFAKIFLAVVRLIGPMHLSFGSRVHERAQPSPSSSMDNKRMLIPNNLTTVKVTFYMQTWRSQQRKTGCLSMQDKFKINGVVVYHQHCALKS